MGGPANPTQPINGLRFLEWIGSRRMDWVDRVTHAQAYQYLLFTLFPLQAARHPVLSSLTHFLHTCMQLTPSIGGSRQRSTHMQLSLSLSLTCLTAYSCTHSSCISGLSLPSVIVFPPPREASSSCCSRSPTPCSPLRCKPTVPLPSPMPSTTSKSTPV